MGLNKNSDEPAFAFTLIVLNKELKLIEMCGLYKLLHKQFVYTFPTLSSNLSTCLSIQMSRENILGLLQLSHIVSDRKLSRSPGSDVDLFVACRVSACGRGW